MSQLGRQHCDWCDGSWTARGHKPPFATVLFRESQLHRPLGSIPCRSSASANDAYLGPAEHVYVENEWYDGPRAGISDVNGLPHRFTSQWDEVEDEYLGTFLVWPVAPAELALEQEQWAIFVSWNDQFEAGTLGTNSHPGHGGTNTRWDEIEANLASKRKSIPPTAKRAKVQVFPQKREPRYALSGPAYQLSWALI